MSEINEVPTTSNEEHGFQDEGIEAVYDSGKGITEEIVREISKRKNEPQWMLDYRLKSFKHFEERPMPEWGTNDLSGLNLDEFTYFRQVTDEPARDWDDVPEKIKETFERLGVPQAERKFLAGSVVQYESEAIYQGLQEEYEKLGVIFTDTDTALKEYPELFKEHFGTVVPYDDNKFAALNGAVWSGGSFIYVPKGVKIDVPLQLYLRINEETMGQFERTLIIVDEGADITYVEGCTAPTYSRDALHAASVEVIVKKDAKFRYTTIQNWSDNVYNLVTKRAHAYENAIMEWVDGNLGAHTTMKYPSIYLKGRGAVGNTISVAMASANQIQDTGAKVFHEAPDTKSSIISKSIARGGGKVNYLGQVGFGKNADRAFSHIECDTIIMDDLSTSDTIPFNETHNPSVTLEHEAKVSKISEEQLYYLMSRGLSEEKATEMIVQGFVEPFSKELPMEYAVELNRLIAYEMEGSVG